MQSLERMPKRVAVHFNFEGKANGWMSATENAVYFGLIPVGLLAFFGLLLWLSWRFPKAFPLNVPHKDDWMATENRGRALRIMAPAMLWLSCVLLLFFTALYWQVEQANRMTPPRLPEGALIPTLVVFFAMLMLWTAKLFHRFTRVDLRKVEGRGDSSARVRR